MSVEKLSDASRSYVESTPFTQIANHVIEHIKNNDAFRLWSYLYSKSRSWKVIKEYAAKVCGIGERKSDYIWSYLKRCGLIEYIEVKDEQGKYLKTDIRILNGSKFDKDVLFRNTKKSTPAETAASAQSTPAKSTPAETAAAEMYPLRKKEGTKERSFKRNKDKSFYGDQKSNNGRKHEFAESMNQMASERRHIQEHEKNKYSPMPESLRRLCKQIKKNQVGAT